MLIHSILQQAAQKWPDKNAVWFNGAWKTFAELETGAKKVSSFLLAQGLQPGDRVGILLENSFDYIIAHFGALMAGGVDVSLNTEHSGEVISQLVNDCEAKFLFVGKKFFKQWSGILESIPSCRNLIIDQKPLQPLQPPARLHVSYLNEVLNGSEQINIAPRRIDIDLGSLVYTSGSTGKPKGVMLSHLNLVSNSKSIAEYLELKESDRVVVVLPFYYIYGRSILYTQLMVGGSIVIDNRFAFPVTVLNTIQEMEATGFAGVPSTFSILLNKTDLKSRKFPHLRFVTQAGGGMAPTLQKEMVETFHSARFYVMYGTTEAAPRLTFVEPEMLPKKWGSIGKPVPNVEVVVVDEKGNKVPQGTQGEIAARGSNIMQGYWRDSAATAEVMKNGYYMTGDLGYEDADGYLFVTGRSRDIIKAGGNRISAKEIEDTVLELPSILETAVIGVPDEILGEAIKVFVVPCDSGITEDAVKNHLQRRLPAFKHPKWIVIKEALPKNQSGKILKSVLRELESQSTCTN